MRAGEQRSSRHTQIIAYNAVRHARVGLQNVVHGNICKGRVNENLSQPATLRLKTMMLRAPCKAPE